MIDLGFFDPKADKDKRKAVERRLREALDKGIPCSLINLENQIINGYDDSGFFDGKHISSSHCSEHDKIS